MALTIRDARADEVDAIAGLVVRSWAWAYAGIFSPEIFARYGTHEARAEITRAALERGWDVLVAEEAGSLVGTVSEFRPARIPGYDTELDHFYVTPEAAGRGVGGALFSAITDRFRTRGARAMALHTLEANTVGRRFYEAHGGRLIGTITWNGYPCVWYAWRPL